MAKRKGLKPRIKWPQLDKPIDQWSEAELRAVAINPIVTGLGRHPRTVSDEDWVVSCRRVIKDVGTAQFLVDLIHVLRTTSPLYVGPSPPTSAYPESKDKSEIPLPNVSHPGDRRPAAQWNEGDVGGILCNPVYTGIPPYAKKITETTWINAALKQIGTIGADQFLVNMLYSLKRTFGAPGHLGPVPPYGYATNSENT